MSELDDLITRLDSADQADRIYAAEDIGYTNRAECVAPLLARLEVESSRGVREAIFGALQSIEDDAVTEGGIRLLIHEDSFVRNQAVELLRLRGPAVVPFLAQAFRTFDKAGRKAVIDVLGAVNGPGSAAIYHEALADPDVNVVITVVESLGHTGQTEFRERVERIATSDNPMLAGACLETLSQIGNEQSLTAIRAAHDAGHPMADLLLPSYLKVLGAQGNASAIAEAAGMLGSCGGHLQISVLDAITRLRQRHPSAPLPASLVTPLQDIVDHASSASLRHEALQVMGGLVECEGVVAFLAAHRQADEDFVAPEDTGV